MPRTEEPEIVVRVFVNETEDGTPVAVEVESSRVIRQEIALELAASALSEKMYDWEKYYRLGPIAKLSARAWEVKVHTAWRTDV
jgi:hypothetical protein